jgi:RNA-directed DNA polymerase
MKEPYGEGVANHADPESCGTDREVRTEALTGAHAGMVLSSEITPPGGRPRRDVGKATESVALSRVADSARGVEDPCMYGNSMSGNREGSASPDGNDGPSGRPAKARSYEAGMNETEQSDRCIVPQRPANKGPQGSAESVEGRRRIKGNTPQAATLRTQSRDGVANGLQRVREAARRDRCAKFTALLHHVTIDLLRYSYAKIHGMAASGVDGQTKAEYEDGLDERLKDLHQRLHRGSYRAVPSRRVYIPKPDGGQRPLGVAALEDKIVQGAVVEVLNCIYEEDFKGFSYGFRPNRGPQQALDALWVAIAHHKVNWVLDADIRGFFDAIDHGWLLKFIEHRIGDRRIIRLITKWLKAGVMEDGCWSRTEAGTPQGATISPLLANVYLHYVLDLWVEQWRQTQARGEVYIVRYADDFILGFQHREEAERFLAELSRRSAKFGLMLHPDKTRLIEFGRFATENRRKRGQGKPKAFNFLGFTHICGKTRKGKFTIRRKTSAKRLAGKLKTIRKTLLSWRHRPFQEVAGWLRQVLNGYFNYHAIPGNLGTMDVFRTQVVRAWLRALQRRSQRRRKQLTWARFARIADDWLPRARCRQTWPSERFYARHPR